MLPTSSTPAPSWWNSLGDYPPWFVALCLTLAAAIAIWIFAKLVKWALWLLLIVVIVGGGATVLGLLMR